MFHRGTRLGSRRLVGIALATLIVSVACQAPASAPSSAPAAAPAAASAQASAPAAQGTARASASVGVAEGPNRPESKPQTLDVKTTAILVLDLSARCADARQPCSKLVTPLGDFLEKARAAAIPIIYSVSASAKGTPLGEVAAPLKRRASETVIYPDAFDKFAGGELQAWLKERGAKTLVMTGASTNTAVLYTATTAARIYQYSVVVPLDGTVAASKYEQEYTIHQFTVMPSDANKLFSFTSLSTITFK